MWKRLIISWMGQKKRFSVGFQVFEENAVGNFYSHRNFQMWGKKLFCFVWGVVDTKNRSLRDNTMKTFDHLKNLIWRKKPYGEKNPIDDVKNLRWRKNSFYVGFQVFEEKRGGNFYSHRTFQMWGKKLFCFEVWLIRKTELWGTTPWKRLTIWKT